MKSKYFLFLLSVLIFGNNLMLTSQTNANILESPEVKKAFDVLNTVLEKDKFVSKLDSISLLSLPIGIGSKGAKNEETKKEDYAITISEAKLRNGKFFITAYMAFIIPGTKKRVAFMGKNIPFDFKGGLKGDVELQLISDVSFDLTSKVGIKLKDDGGTKVKWDCNGFKSMDISADLRLDSTMFIPENNDGSLNESESLRCSFKQSISNWNDFFVTISLSPFQIKGITGIGFKITNATLDLSDTKNPTGLSFNESYSNHFIDGNQKLWQGLYIQEAEIRLPPQFKKNNSSESGSSKRVKFYSQNLWIDELGFTGKMGGNQILPLHEGDMSGWAFSVDDISIDIRNNILKSGKFNGQIRVPELKKNSLFEYNAQFGANDTYAFNIIMKDSLDFNMWAAKINVHPNSSLKIKVVDHKFLPTLLLNGTMNLEVPLKKGNPNSKKLSLGNIDFQGLKIQTIEPCLEIESISYGKKQNKFAKFPISLTEIGIASKQNEIGLKLGVNINFTKPKAGGFSGKGTFTVWAKKNDDKWNYDRIDISSIGVDISKGNAFKLHGELNFINGDNIYGDGFKGVLDASFSGYEMNALALFGKVDDYRYWFADALLSKSSGIGGPLAIYQFGGGAYYHVKQDGVKNLSKNSIGASLSGICYKPYKNKGLGLKAMVKFGLKGQKETFNGDALFNMSFNTNGGVNFIAFEGNAYFATHHDDLSKNQLQNHIKNVMENTSGAIKIPKDPEKSKLHANIKMKYDFLAKSFHSTLDVYVNIAGGLITGIKPGGLAGHGVVHFDPSDWYVYLGTPKDPNGVEILKIAKMKNYFMAGKTMPELPELPARIRNSKIGSYKSASSDNLGDGKGFAFGSSFNFDTGQRNFLIFYGQFGCGIGFDLLMKNYGNTTCEGSNSPIGINGWYAQGQAYAWIKAEVGVKVNLRFYKGKFSIFDVELAALLQTKAPNPFWMKGNVDGNYKILHGLIKGHCHFEFEIGKKCKLESSNPLGGMQIISAITPSNGETDIDVFNTPQVVFNMPVDKEIKIKNEKKQNEIYKINLEQFKITDTKGEQLIGSVSWNERNDVVIFQPKNIMPGKTNIKVFVKVTFKKLVNGSWITVVEKGKIAQEIKEITFTTDVAPDYIPKNNVKYSYPTDRSLNYYKLETNTNYITLKSGQPKLFNVGKEWKQEIRITPVAGGKSVTTNCQYNESNNQINFHIPNNITKNKVHKLEIVNIPIVKTKAIDRNVHKKEDLLKLGGNNNNSNVIITTNEAKENISELQEKVIYALNFRTSKYNTFSEKINGLNFSNGVLWETAPLVHSLTSNIRGEIFDIYEIENSLGNKMIDCEPILSETSWYINNIKPIFDLSTDELRQIRAKKFTVNKNTTYLFKEYGTRILSQNEINTGIATNTIERSGMKNYIAKYTQEYLAYLKGCLANSYIDKSCMPGLNKLFNAKFTSLKRGSYPVKITYTLPGKTVSNTIVKRYIKF